MLVANQLEWSGTRTVISTVINRDMPNCPFNTMHSPVLVGRQRIRNGLIFYRYKDQGIKRNLKTRNIGRSNEITLLTL